MLPKYARSVGEAHGNRISLCYMDTDSFIYEIETEDFYKDIGDNIESRFNTSSYRDDGLRPLPVGMNKKVIGLMKDELGGDIMREFVALRPKMYAYKVESNNKKRSHTQLDSRKQVIAFQDRVITINIKEAQHPLK